MHETGSIEGGPLMSQADQLITEYSDLELLIRNEVANIRELPPIPESFNLDEAVTFAHEGGHLVAALSLGQQIYAYNISGRLKWISSKAPEDKQRIVEARLEGREGVVSHTNNDVSSEDEKIFAAAGCAGELVYFNRVESAVPEQESDRKKGKFRSMQEVLDVADELADRFEGGDLSLLHKLVMQRIARGKGFDDLNVLIGRGVKLNTLL